jgi:phosphoserine phosphatase
MGSVSRIGKDQEAGMTFLGFLVLFDPPKPDIVKTIGSLEALGVSLKIITGDNHLVAASVSHQMGLSNTRIITGPDLRQMSDGALLTQVGAADVFAEIEPNQKERIILALRKAGNVVGYMGDGINDASALHAADVGISVESAVDVAKEAADIVLLEKDLSVLVQGVREGRTTFANTLKYVFMATSANFGNMFSMAGASLFLPFLPLLPKQVLLTNLMTDFPEMTIATDSVDDEMVAYPRRWDIKAIRKFMITNWDNYYGLHCHGGSGEAGVLQKGEILKWSSMRDRLRSTGTVRGAVTNDCGAHHPGVPHQEARAPAPLLSVAHHPTCRRLSNISCVSRLSISWDSTAACPPTPRFNRAESSSCQLPGWVDLALHVP